MADTIPDWASTKEKVRERLFSTQMLLSETEAVMPTDVRAGFWFWFNQFIAPLGFEKNPTLNNIIRNYADDCVTTLYMRYVIKTKFKRMLLWVNKEIKANPRRLRELAPFRRSLRKEADYIDQVIIVLRAHYTQQFFKDATDFHQGDVRKAIHTLGPTIRFILTAFQKQLKVARYRVEPVIKELVRRDAPNFYEAVTDLINTVLSTEAAKVTETDYPWMQIDDRLPLTSSHIDTAALETA